MGVSRVFAGFFFLVVLIIAGALIGASLKKLSSTEVGIEYDRWAKQLDEAAKTGGLHLGPVGYKFVKFPSTQITADLADTCVSKDGLRVRFEITFQYQVAQTDLIDAIVQYRDYKTWSQVVEAAGSSGVQHSCSQFNVTDFQSLRGVIQDAMFDNLKMKLEGSLNGTLTDDGVYARASSFQLKNIELPTEYKDSVAQKQRAEEDIALAKNQRNQETTRARTEFLAAKEEAQKILNTAYNTGNVTLVEAKLKAEETLFAFGKEEQVLLQAKTNFGLTPNGILAYMTNQLYASTPQLTVSVGEPAKISRKEDLSKSQDSVADEL